MWRTRPELSWWRGLEEHPTASSALHRLAWGLGKDTLPSPWQAKWGQEQGQETRPSSVRGPGPLALWQQHLPLKGLDSCCSDDLTYTGFISQNFIFFYKLLIQQTPSWDIFNAGWHKPCLQGRTLALSVLVHDGRSMRGQCNSTGSYLKSSVSQLQLCWACKPMFGTQGLSHGEAWICDW